MKAKKNIAKFLLSFSLGCVSIIGSACAAEKIVIGFDPTYAPFEYKNSDGTYGGFDYALGNELCKRMKIQCTWKEINFDGSIPALKARKIDAILSAMSITEERSKQVDFSVPLYNIPTALVVKKGSVISLNNLPAGTSVGVTQGTTQETYAHQVLQPKGVNVVAYASQDLVYQDLNNGRLDATLTNAATATEGFLKLPQGKSFMISQPVVSDTKFFGKGVGIAFRKDDLPLQKEFDAAITGIKQDGTLSKISTHYFNFAIQ